MARGAAAERAWRGTFEAYRAGSRWKRPSLSAAWRAICCELCRATGRGAGSHCRQASAFATRKASQNALDALAPLLPEFFGGSADLTGSNLTNFKGCVKAGRDHWGNHLSYGVREFGMAAIMNGMALHGGYIPYGGTFLTFSDYSRNAIRMAALMKLRVIHVFTHDSIGLGEDGPTHQSVEHIPTLRIIPGLDVWRPADGLETAVAWACAVERKDGPSALCLSRQNLPRLTDVAMADNIRKGGYVLSETWRTRRRSLCPPAPRLELAMEAQARPWPPRALPPAWCPCPAPMCLTARARPTRKWCCRWHLPTVAIEAAHPDFWRKYVGRTGVVIGMPTFGESAPAPQAVCAFRHHAGACGGCGAQCWCTAPPPPCRPLARHRGAGHQLKRLSVTMSHAPLT